MKGQEYQMQKARVGALGSGRSPGQEEFPGAVASAVPSAGTEFQNSLRKPAILKPRLPRLLFLFSGFMQIHATSLT